MRNNLWKYVQTLGSFLFVMFLIIFIPLKPVYGVPANFVKVPNVLNISMDQAVQSLRNAQLGSTVKYLPVDDPKYNNMVKIQSHKPGDMLPKGTVVTLTVLKYTSPPPMAKVPNVLNISMDQAVQAISHAELRSTIKYLPVDNPKYNNMVKMQSHKPGDMIPKGTVVTLTVLQFHK
ncbi:MAG: hypothetical protein C0407_18250 [Desulfobacca sp.]|nr:hypothetical protein [Desulfobacca sp.]